MRDYGFGPHRIRSALPIAELAAVGPDAPADPAILIREVTHLADEESWALLSEERDAAGTMRIRAWRRGDDIRLRFQYLDHHADFILADGGTLIAAHRSAAVPDAHVGSLLAGPVIGRALRLQGRACLHATICARGEEAIGIMAPSGAGKSSLAAALARAGCDIVTDDLAIIEARGDAPFVHPGLARVKLNPDAMMAGAGAAPMFPGVAGMGKMSVPVGRARGGAIRLRACYQLLPRAGAAGEAVIGRLPAPAAAAALAANVYGTLTAIPALRHREFAQAATLAASCPVFGLRLPDSLPALDGQRDALAQRLFA